MAIFDWPDEIGIQGTEWTLDRPAQINRSDYTGKRRVVANPWHGKWSVRVQLAPVGTGVKARTLKAFFASLKGQVNTFRLPATEGEQEHLPAATVAVTAAQGATSMTIAGAFLQPGHMATVNDQLLQIIESAGAVITFEPPLRQQATAATAIETGNPTCLMAMADSQVGWQVELGPFYRSSFDAEEVF